MQQLFLIQFTLNAELKETVSHVGQKLVETVKNTWNMMYHLAVNKSVDAAESVIQRELNQVTKENREEECKVMGMMF